MPKYKFVKQKEEIKEKIKASHDPLKDWHADPKGYFLIRIKNKRIEVGYATNKHVIKKIIYGKNAIYIYNTIIKKKLLTRLEHAAYLGKELYKAELALKYGKKYVQECPFTYNEKVKVKLKMNS